jgi:hypothetical protein
MSITIRDVWKKYNVTTIMFLPLFNDSCKPFKSLTNGQIDVLFSQLCFEYGLINCYLKEENGIYYLGLLFNKELVNNKETLTNTKWYCLNDLIIDLPEFCSLELLNSDSIIYFLQIPPEHKEDIEHIKNSSYSKVSELFKERTKVKVKKIPKTDNAWGTWIVTHNMPYSIFNKFKVIKTAIEEVIVKTLNDDDELYTRFNPETESLERQRELLSITGANLSEVQES